MAGRGRLSSIDLLPEEARDDVLWAIQELNKRRRTQADILFEFNDRLEAKGLEPVSSSAFNRKAMRLAAMQRRLDEARHVFAGLADQFTPEVVDESSLALGEMIKMLINEMLDDPDNSPKQAAELARAYQSVIQGQKLSAERRRRLEADYAAKAAKAIDKVATEVGLTAERADQLRRDILGVRPSTGKVDDGKLD